MVQILFCHFVVLTFPTDLSVVKRTIAFNLKVNMLFPFVQVSFSAGGWRQLSRCGRCGEFVQFTEAVKQRLVAND